MALALETPCTAFAGPQRVAAAPLQQLATRLRSWVAEHEDAPAPLVFDDETGEQIELDLRGSEADVLARLAERVAGGAPPKAAPEPPRGPGRPRLGVVAREVTLLPRHWEWLGLQPGGASVALRKLVDEARRTAGSQDEVRRAREACYRFLSSAAGNQPGLEEAARALFAGDAKKFEAQLAGWPADLAEHARKLAAPGFTA